jgi:hypothetical protein
MIIAYDEADLPDQPEEEEVGKESSSPDKIPGYVPRRLLVTAGSKECKTLQSIQQTESDAALTLPETMSLEQDIYTPIRQVISSIIGPPPLPRLNIPPTITTTTTTDSTTIVSGATTTSNNNNKEIEKEEGEDTTSPITTTTNNNNNTVVESTAASTTKETTPASAPAPVLTSVVAPANYYLYMGQATKATLQANNQGRIILMDHDDNNHNNVFNPDNLEYRKQKYLEKTETAGWVDPTTNNSTNSENNNNNNNEIKNIGEDEQLQLGEKFLMSEIEKFRNRQMQRDK